MSKNFWRNVFHGSDLSKETGPYVQRIRVNTYPVRLKCPKIPGEWPPDHRFALFFWSYLRRDSLDCFGHFVGYSGSFGHIRAEGEGGPFLSPYFFGHIPAARTYSKGVKGTRTFPGMREMNRSFTDQPTCFDREYSVTYVYELLFEDLTIPLFCKL